MKHKNLLGKIVLFLLLFNSATLVGRTISFENKLGYALEMHIKEGGEFLVLEGESCELKISDVLMRFHAQAKNIFDGGLN